MNIESKDDHWLKSFNRPKFAAAIVIAFFLISLSGILFPSIDPLVSKVVNRNYNGEGLIELIEAFCWISASIIYLLILRKKKEERWNLAKFWLLFFIVFCFVAFGEEISWGQHIFGFEPTEAVQTFNKQKEFNFHNLNISEIFGIDADHPTSPYVTNLTTLLNPLFYLLCSIFWFVIPLLKKYLKLSKSKIIAALPMPDFGTVIFCGANVIAFLIIDKIFFDIGEIFELGLALVGIMVPLDVYLREQKLTENSLNVPFSAEKTLANEEPAGKVAPLKQSNRL